MIYGYDRCDGDGCGVLSNQHPFPHESWCKYNDNNRVAECSARRYGGPANCGCPDCIEQAGEQLGAEGL